MDTIAEALCSFLHLSWKCAWTVAIKRSASFLTSQLSGFLSRLFTLESNDRTLKLTELQNSPPFSVTGNGSLSILYTQFLLNSMNGSQDCVGHATCSSHKQRRRPWWGRTETATRFAFQWLKVAATGEEVPVLSPLEEVQGLSVGSSVVMGWGSTGMSYSTVSVITRLKYGHSLGLRGWDSNCKEQPVVCIFFSVKCAVCSGEQQCVH